MRERENKKKKKKKEKDTRKEARNQPKQDYPNRMKDERVVGTTYVGPFVSPC